MLDRFFVKIEKIWMESEKGITQPTFHSNKLSKREPGGTFYLDGGSALLKADIP